MQALRIVTINTGKGDGAYRPRIDWLAEELAALEPDVVALQESFRDRAGDFDTAETLIRRTGLTGCWSPARLKRRWCDGREVESWSGMALLSRIPLSQVDIIDLPADPDDGDRVAQVGYFEAEDRRIVIANLHLTHLRERDDLRSEQLQCVLEHPQMRADEAIRLVCGDFNTTLAGPVLGELVGDGPFGSVTDAYTAGGGPRDRATLKPRAGATEGRCVDHILSVAPSGSEHPVFTSSAVVLKRPQPGTGLLPSDHFGVATTLLPLRTSRRPSREERELVG